MAAYLYTAKWFITWTSKMKKSFKVLSVLMASATAVFAFAGAASAAEGTFKVGGIGPLTGGAAIYGQAAMNGAQIAVDQINAMDGAVKFERKDKTRKQVSVYPKEA